MTPPTNTQWFRLFDLIAEGFQSEYNPIRMSVIGGLIRDLAREMFPVEEPSPVKSKSVMKRLAVQKPGSRAYPGYLDPSIEEDGKEK